MLSTVVTAAYIVAALLFILSLAGLSKHESAKHGNWFGMAGMTIALLATIALVIDGVYGEGEATDAGKWGLGVLVVTMALGGLIGVRIARRVEMTGMPELIAMMHSFVGLAAVLVGYNTFLASHGDSPEAVAEHQRLESIDMVGIHNGEVFIGVFIGAVTFTGSIVAYLKLSAKMKSSPLVLPARHWLNLLAVLVSIGLCVWFVVSPSIVPLGIMTVIALLFGWHLVASIGGGDMPVVVSMLNSYSGWAAAAAGFLLGNDLLIITGALVGSSGAYLSYIMCKAMNRSFISVIAGGFGSDGQVTGEDKDYGEHREIQAEQVAEAGGDDLLDPGVGEHVLHGLAEVVEHQDRRRARIHQLMPQLARGVHRIGVDHRQPGAQHAEDRDRILQAVGHHDRDAIALLEFQFAEQVLGELPAARVELGVGDRPAHVRKRGPVAEAGDRFLEDGRYRAVLLGIDLRGYTSRIVRQPRTVLGHAVLSLISKAATRNGAVPEQCRSIGA